jgi:type III secretion protein V
MLTHLTRQALPLAVVLVVALMVVPLPNLLLDTLLAINLALSLLLLLSAVGVKRPESFTVLPAILLLCTLFRLGLNVATTRQLLSTGEAPMTIQAFGEFVVGGNLIVGAVVFLIVTLVQFIVISKGAERVAEVSARFALDAMPGKQISIDADLRSGVISLAEARLRRLELQKESKLYGALDGAMKFIKGDAVAGLFITCLNMVAGIVAGITIHKMGFDTAVSRFTIYTVGDGLVSQLPALLVSIAAGLAVTRVSGEESVGRDLFLQLTEEKSVPLVTALLLGMVAMLPGTPTLAFIVPAIALVVVWLGLASQREVSVKPPSFRGHPPLALELSQEALGILQRRVGFVEEVQELRRCYFKRWGLVLPEPEIEILAGAEGAVANFRRYGTLMAAVTGEEGFSEQVLWAFERLAVERSLEFLDDTQTRLILESYDGRCEDLINSVVPGILSITRLTGVFRRLLEERVPLKDLPGILQGVLEWHSQTGVPEGMKDELLMICVRRKLRQLIAESLPDGELSVVTLSPEIEQLLSKVVLEGSGVLPSLADEIAAQTGGAEIVLCSEVIRGLVARTLRDKRVYSFTEVTRPYSIVSEVGRRMAA